jgi:hypothetical protein
MQKEAIEQQVEPYLHFQKSQEEYIRLKQALFAKYMHIEPHKPMQDSFFCMNGSSFLRLSLSSAELTSLFSCTPPATRNGGYFFRYNQKGICVNPSTHFLEQFCNFGLHVWDIDTVVVTSAAAESAKELELIHQLNCKLNSMLVSYEQEPHVISYLVHPASYARFASFLRPLYREEKGSVISLDTFQKEEKIDIAGGVRVAFKNNGPEELLIRLEYKTSSFGYGTASFWDDSCSSFFQGCDRMLLGMGSLSIEDLEGLSCGNFSSAIAAMQKNPYLRLLLLSEFDSALGDIRLAAARKCASNQIHAIPLDHGFKIALDTFSDSHEMKVARQSEPFSQLLYFPKDHVL